MPCDPSLVSSYNPSLNFNFFYLLVSCPAKLCCHRPNPNTFRRVVVFRSERVNETIVVHYASQEQNLQFHCVCVHFSTCTNVPALLWGQYASELKGLRKKLLFSILPRRKMLPCTIASPLLPQFLCVTYVIHAAL